MDIKLSFGLHLSSGKILHISEVDRGVKCNCICPKCKVQLEAHKGDIRQHHFKHASNTDCRGGFESALHAYAKQVIVEAKSIVRTKYHTINYDKVICEKVVGLYRPDIIIELENGEKVYIEVFVSNIVKKVKIDYFKQNKFKSFEIDLSGISERNNLIDLQNLKRKILKEYENRKMLYWDEPQTTMENKDSSFWIISSIVGIIILCAINPFRKNNRRRKKYK